MMHPQAATTKKLGLNDLHAKIAVAAALCFLASLVIPHFQAMTACITALLCTQSNTAANWKTGLTRLLITAIGGLAGVLVVALDLLVANRWLLALWIGLGVLVTMQGCKLAKAPEFSARIGAVTFILVALTLTRTNRILYAVYRLISTCGGVVIVLAVSALFSLGMKRRRG